MSITTTTNAKIQLSLEGVQQVESGLARVQGVAGSAAKALAGIAGGVFSAVAFKDWIQGAIDAADETNKLTQKTGLLAEQVAGLKLAFELGGAGDAFASSLSRLAKEAVGGNKAFAAMGLSVTDASGKLKGTRDLLVEVANKFAGYRDGPEKAALAMELFGKAGADLIPVLNGGAKSFADMDAKAKELGLTIDGDMAAAAEKFNDDLEIMKGRISGVAISLAGPILSGLNGLIEKFQEGSREGQNFITTLLKQTEIAGFLGMNKIANPYTDTRVELERLNLALASGKLNVTQTLALEEKRTELARKMSGYLSGTANGRRGAEDPNNINRGDLPRAPGVGGDGPKPRTPKAPKADRDEFAELLNRVSMKDAGLDPSFYKDLETLYAGYQKGRVAVDDYREAVEALVTSQKFAQDQNKATKDALEEEQKQTQATIDAMAELIEGRRSAAASTLENAEAQRQANAEYGLEGVALVELQNARLLDAAAALDRRAALAKDIDFSGAMSESYAQEAKALRELAGARMSGAVNQQQAREIEKQTKAYEQMWQGVEGFAYNAFMDLAENGEGAAKRIGDALEREVLQLLYEMTIKKWIFQVAGVGGGGGGGVDWVSLAQSAYSKYTGGGGAGGAGGGAGAAGGGAAIASQYGTTAGSQQTAMLAAQETGMGAASTSWMTYMGYAALIAAAVMVASNLYEKGYTRMALGYGGSETAKFGQYSSYTTDPNTQRAGAMQNSPAMLMTNDMRKFNDMLGMSEQWSDILSGTTRMGTLVGRKLSAYGYQADIAGGDSETSGFARYKGGVLRSNKTVKADVDPRDAAAFDAVVESTIEGSKAMARAMGMSDEAIDKYTGSLKVNFKGAKTAEEQSKRMAEAMENLNFELLKTAAGGKLAREDFKQFLEEIQGDIQAAGISGEGIADILVAGMTGRLSGADVGAQLSDMLLGGIYNAIASSGAAQISQLFMTQIITPIFTAIASGVPLSQAVSAAAMKQTMETAKQYMEAVKVIFNDPAFQAWVQEFKGMLNSTGSAAASVAAPSMRNFGPTPAQTAAQEAKREREQLEREILRLEDNTVELRRRELLDIKPGNRALQERIWALEDEREALDKVTQLQDAWTGLTDSIEEEIKRLRGIVSGEGSANLAYLQAQFAIVTGQARAMDQDAAGRLPDLSSQLADLYMESSSSLSEYQRRVNALAASLEETNRITRDTAGITADGTQKVKDEELAQQIKLLQQSVEVLTARMEENNKAAATTATALSKASTGNGLRTVST